MAMRSPNGEATTRSRDSLVCWVLLGLELSASDSLVGLPASPGLSECERLKKVVSSAGNNKLVSPEVLGTLPYNAAPLESAGNKVFV